MASEKAKKSAPKRGQALVRLGEIVRNVYTVDVTRQVDQAALPGMTLEEVARQTRQLDLPPLRASDTIEEILDRAAARYGLPSGACNDLRLCRALAFGQFIELRDRKRGAKEGPLLDQPGGMAIRKRGQRGLGKHNTRPPRRRTKRPAKK